jgi:hypothetical protein
MDSRPDTELTGSEPALAPPSGTPDDIPSGENVVLPAKKKWGNQIILLGIGGVAVVLALSGLLWAVRQRPPHPVLEIEPTTQVSPAPAQPAPPPPAETFPVPETNTAPVTVTTVPPESVRYEVKSLPMPSSPEATPEVSPDAPTTKASAAPGDWAGEMRQELAQCGGFFCREKVRWKYCNNRWNSIPECATGQNQ